nr:uncharacterized protein LOC109153434 [Ipomoea batatas]
MIRNGWIGVAAPGSHLTASPSRLLARGERFLERKPAAGMGDEISSPTTPLAAKSDTWDLILQAAADQDLKFRNQTPIKDHSSENFRERLKSILRRKHTMERRRAVVLAPANPASSVGVLVDEVAALLEVVARVRCGSTTAPSCRGSWPSRCRSTSHAPSAPSSPASQSGPYTDKFGVDLEVGECGDGGLRNSAAVSGGRRPCSSEAMEVGNTEVSGVPPEKMISSVSECFVEVDLEGFMQKRKPNCIFLRTERDYMICHMSMNSENQEPSGGSSLN